MSEGFQCSRCEAVGCWDRIGEIALCPGCEEALAACTAPALQLTLTGRECIVCRKSGTVPYRTYPHRTGEPIELDLCPYHFAALLGRQLSPQAFRSVVDRIVLRGLTRNAVFLVHDQFYDVSGRALVPVVPE